jgi:hypothetical protein
VARPFPFHGSSAAGTAVRALVDLAGGGGRSRIQAAPARTWRSTLRGAPSSSYVEGAEASGMAVGCGFEQRRSRSKVGGGDCGLRTTGSGGGGLRRAHVAAVEVWPRPPALVGHTAMVADDSSLCRCWCRVVMVAVPRGWLVRIGSAVVVLSAVSGLIWWRCFGCNMVRLATLVTCMRQAWCGIGRKPPLTCCRWA